VRLESSWKKTGERGSLNSVLAPQLRAEAKPSRLSDHCSFPPAKSYAAVLSYAVMRPGDSSRVHTHPGPEGWYVLTGEQCLETPAGANKARAGGNHDGATEYSNGIECHGYDAPARVCPGHP
jgi:hypothetical protein